MQHVPDFDDILAAAARIDGLAHRTPVLRSSSLDTLTGARVHLKCENFQRTGAFKFRGACNAVFSLDDDQAARGVVTQSSGNHGAAIALACRLRGIAATVVVPQGAAAVKLAAIERYGARVVRCEPTQAARDAATQDLLERTSGTLVHPFDDLRVIAGQGTAALELIDEVGHLDAILAPVSGGGLLSGTLLAARGRLPDIDVVGAEPEDAADAHASLARGERVQGWPISTICDGLRAELGPLAFQLLHGRADVLLASETEIIAAMRLVLDRLKILVEPSCAVPLAVMLRHPARFAGKRVGMILSGGNVDLDRLPWVVAGPESGAGA